MSDKPTIDQQFTACDEQLLADLLRDGYTVQEIDSAVAMTCALFTPIMDSATRIGGAFRVNPGRVYSLFWRINHRVNREVTAIHEQAEIEGEQP